MLILLQQSYLVELTSPACRPESSRNANRKMTDSCPCIVCNLVSRQCKALGEGVCGIYEERSNAGASKTGSIKPNVCGTPVGWLGAHSACGARREVGVSFPDAYPFDCHRAARHGIFEQVHLCVPFWVRNTARV